MNLESDCRSEWNILMATTRRYCRSKLFQTSPTLLEPSNFCSSYFPIRRVVVLIAFPFIRQCTIKTGNGRDAYAIRLPSLIGRTHPAVLHVSITVVARTVVFSIPNYW